MRKLDYDSEFDAAYNYFTAWGYYDDETDFDILERVCCSLKKGGRFMIEFMGRDWLIRNFQPRSWYDLSDETILLEDRSFDFLTGRSHSKRTYITPSETKVIEIDVRIPTTDEFVRIFRDAGFEGIRLLEAPDGGEVTFDSRRIAVVGIKS
jgi:hypothetical protein